MKKTIKKWLIWTIMLVTLFTSLPFGHAKASESVDTIVSTGQTFGETLQQSAEDLPAYTYTPQVEEWSFEETTGVESDFLGYIESIAYRSEDGAPTVYARTVGSRLSGVNATIYNKLKGYIAEVAAGNRASTVFSIPVTELGLDKTSWTAEELGVDAIISNSSISTDAMQAVDAKVDWDISVIIDALLFDCPYELYWYDKTERTRSTGFTYAASYDYRSGECLLEIQGSISISFPVAAEYSAGDYVINTEIGKSVQTIVSTAKNIVAKYANSSDREKLLGYKNEICSLVAYNDDAAQNDVSYGNPWQIIWVFDGNASTNVVCEGYAKAFKYLCDLTAFENDIYCKLVTGMMYGGTGAGAHMWNVVTMEDGKNYLVDVTNCDDGTVGASDLLFLAKCISGDVSNGYIFQVQYSTMGFAYDEDTLSNYDASELTIRSVNDPDTVPGGDDSGDDSQTTPPGGDDVIETTPMYRLYNPNSGEHFYTGSIEERDMLVNAGWRYEGVSWNAPISGGVPVHRMYNPNSGDHHYTTSQDEVNMLLNAGWKYEGVAWNSASADNVPLYRLYNPNADCGSHHYTGSTEERDMLISIGWKYEGIGWYGMLK